MSEPVLQLKHLDKSYDTEKVIIDVSAEVEPGDVIGLLGLNGAGKTTLLETALGFAIPDSGSVTLFGQESGVIQDEKLKHRVGFVPQQDELLETMKGREFLSLISKFYPAWNHDLINRLAKDWEVPLEKQPFRMSIGQRQKLSILAALGHEPELIVLDEPVASLDPLARRTFLQELIEMVTGGKRTILFSTHIVSDLERIANRVWILKDGNLVVDQPLDNLKETSLAAIGGSGILAGVRIDPGMALEDIFLELHK